jgi:threonine/homoserine/homoserine lactone efflux protein
VLFVIAKGIFTAIVMTIGVGPGMLINFHTSMRKGFFSGLSVVAGLYASDLTFIAVNYFGVFRIAKSFSHQNTGALVCGLLLCTFGIVMAFKKPRAIEACGKSAYDCSAASFFKDFLSGFIVNISNPFVFVFWMTLMGIASLNFGFRTGAFHIYFLTVICAALSLDITKSWLFSRIGTGIKENVMKIINITTGTVLASAGIAIICRSIIMKPLSP